MNTPQLSEAWQSFIDKLTPIRPELFQYALKLTGNPFDAEDLVSDSLLKTFASLALQDNRAQDLKRYLLTIMSRTWIDELRRRQRWATQTMPELESPVEATDQTDLNEAAAIAIDTLNPHARAVLVLKDVFELTHAEIGAILGIEPNHAKVILHRARRELQQVPETRNPRVTRALVERFISAFQSHDLERMQAVLLEDIEAQVFPAGSGAGLAFHAKEGWLNGSWYHHIEWRERERSPYPLQLRIEDVAGEPVILVLRDPDEVGAWAVEEVWRLEASNGYIARIIDYGFAPDLIRWVADTCGLPCRTIGYRFPDAGYGHLDQRG
ncbi:MAG: RNA polymerase sigma factor [Pseudomonadota bacterium]